jgi:hypothetical protein
MLGDASVVMDWGMQVGGDWSVTCMVTRLSPEPRASPGKGRPMTMVLPGGRRLGRMTKPSSCCWVVSEGTVLIAA